MTILKVKSDHRSKFSNLSNWNEEAWKKRSGLQWDLNLWPPRYWCDALPTELWSHTLGAKSIYWVHISSEEWNDVKYMDWNNSYLNCGCRWKWRMIMTVKLFSNSSLSSTTVVRIWIVSRILHISSLLDIRKKLLQFWRLALFFSQTKRRTDASICTEPGGPLSMSRNNNTLWYF